MRPQEHRPGAHPGAQGAYGHRHDEADRRPYGYAREPQEHQLEHRQERRREYRYEGEDYHRGEEPARRPYDTRAAQGDDYHRRERYALHPQEQWCHHNSWGRGPVHMSPMVQPSSGNEVDMLRMHQVPSSPSLCTSPSLPDGMHQAQEERMHSMQRHYQDREFQQQHQRESARSIENILSRMHAGPQQMWTRYDPRF